MRVSTKTVVIIGMFAAVLSVLSIVAIPMPSGMPITLQTFAVALCGYVLGAKRGMATVMIYILIGAIGIPVYAGMHGGISWLFSYTGGFLWGFVILALLCGIAGTKKKKTVRALISGIGLVLCHVLGMLHYALVAELAIPAAFLAVSAPYLIKDVLSLIGAYAVAKVIKIRLAVSASFD